MPEVLESGLYILGPKVAKLEQKIAALCGYKYAVGVAAGDVGLIMLSGAYHPTAAMVIKAISVSVNF